MIALVSEILGHRYSRVNAGFPRRNRHVRSVGDEDGPVHERRARAGIDQPGELVEHLGELVERHRGLSQDLPQVTSDDILEFGLIPELVGRLPVIATLQDLDEDALVTILTQPKNALVKQYKALFAMEDAELEIREE